jgi:hypothetical protein
MTKPTVEAAGAILDRAFEAGKIEKSGSWYSFADEKIGQGRDKAIAHLIANPEVLAKIEAVLGGEDKPGTDNATANASANGSPRIDQVEPGAHAAKPAPSKRAQTAGDVMLLLPLPDGVPAEVLKAASIVVVAKPARGRRRAGREFTRDETVIPYVDLSVGEINALVTDTELTVSVRLPEPD